MPQIFGRSSNSLARVSIAVVVLLTGGVVWAAYKINAGSFITDVDVAPNQPVPFSHKHHVGDDGIDCRYCHTTVETTASAGFPPTKTCMNCHSQLFSNTQYLEIVRASWRDNQPIKWNRVHDLPDFAYFNHSIHVNKGVGCSTCHGRVDEMPLMWNVASMQMEWCLACHRNPEAVLREKKDITNMEWKPGDDQAVKGKALAQQYGIQPVGVLTSCSTCHR